LFNSLIGLLKTSVHLSLGSSHLSLDLLDSLDMSIIFFLFNWLSWNCWLVGHLFLLHLNFLLNSGFSSLKLHLHLLGLCSSLSNSGDMLSILVNSWVLSLFFLFFFLFLLGNFGGLGGSLGSAHLGPWFLLWDQLSSSGSNSSSLVYIWGIWDNFGSLLRWCWGSSSLSLSLSLSLCFSLSLSLGLSNCS